MIDFFQTLGIKRFVIADCENAETSSHKLLFEFFKEKDFLNLSAQIICFIGAKENQNKFYEDLTNLIQSKKISCNIFPIRIKTASKDALDKVIIAYLGMLMAQKPDAQFVIVSADNGYEAVVKHFVEMGIEIKREPVPKSEKPTAKTKANSKKTLEKKVASDTTEESSTETKKAKVNVEEKLQTEDKDKTSDADKRLEHIADKIISDLEKLKTPKPTTIASVKRRITKEDKSLSSPEKDKIVCKILEKLQNDDKIAIKSGAKITWK